MTLWYDSSAPGNSPITSSADIYTWGGLETKFYLAAASNIIPGQSAGPSVQFSLQSKRDGYSSFQVDYGTVMPPKECSGHLISVTVPGGNPVSVRVIIADNPQEIAALLVGTATRSGSQAISLSVSVGSGVTTVYTCPPNFKATLLRAQLNNTTGGAKTYNFEIEDSTKTMVDYIIPPGGQSVNAGATYFLGQGPGNNVVIGPIVLLPGDQLLAGDGIGGGLSISFELLLEPL